MTNTKYSFETEQCTRCGGGGSMPYSIDNGRCFKCRGNGLQLTTRGNKARKSLEAKREKLCPKQSVSELKAGDVVNYSGKWRVVTAVAEGSTRRLINDEWINDVSLTLCGMGRMGFAQDHTLMVRTEEAQEALTAYALTFVGKGVILVD